MKEIISNITVTLYALMKKTSAEEAYKVRRFILKDLGVNDDGSAPNGEDEFWLFYETYEFPKENYDDIMSIIDKYKEQQTAIKIEVDYFYAFEKCETIKLGDTVRISDPCYNTETWCAGSLNNVLPGRYNCFCQKTGEGRVAAIMALHEEADIDTEDFDLVEDLTVGVDSGMCGIYSQEYFEKNCSHDTWIERIYSSTRGRGCAAIDDSAFISSSGYGDGGYDCYALYDSNDKIVGIKIEYIA